MKRWSIIFLWGLISISIAIFVFRGAHVDATLRGNILYVGGSGPNNYTKIQYAIDNASDGDTIFVYKGIYYENIVIEKDINLVGEHLNKTIIVGDGMDTVWIVKDDACIMGFTIKNIKEEGAGIRLTWDHHIVKNCDISHTKYGILITSSSSNLITNCTFRNNEYGIIITGCKCARGSTNSLIYRNNFIENYVQARDEWSNIWNYKVGNFWDDYAGKDENNDGIGDTPYNISGGFNKDLAPLMEPIDIIPPIVKVLSPNGGEFLAGNVTIRWNVWDNCDPSPKINIGYNMEGNGWHTIATGILNTTEYVWDVSNLPIKRDYIIRVTATDFSGNKGYDTCDGAFTIISPPSLEFVKPKKGHFYFGNKEIFPLPKNMTICIGSIGIEVNAISEMGIEKVEFYIDNELKYVDKEKPYQWSLDDTIFGKHEIKVVAYDNEKNMANVRMIIRIVNL